MRNPEEKKTLVVYIVITAIFTMLAFNIKFFLNYVNLEAGDVFAVFTLIVCTLFIAVHTVTANRRYKKINELSMKINAILHGDSHIEIEEYSEGELAILKSEIYKMTVTLREQQQRLLDDKVYLADSIADISHQIRTPLTSINLLVALLSDENITKEKKQETIRKLYSHLSRIDWLITSLLKMSKLDAKTVQFKNEKIPLYDFLRKAVSPVSVPVELKEQTLAIDASGDFYGDIQWTGEAVLNIVKNCMEHTQSGGTIKITAEENSLYSEIIISDNGPGIPESDLPNIFERFYKGENSSNDSFGIGLALARNIITNQNGTIKAENNGGAVFTIKFYKGTI